MRGTARTYCLWNFSRAEGETSMIVIPRHALESASVAAVSHLADANCISCSAFHTRGMSA
jgi:hypothetical protein